MQSRGLASIAAAALVVFLIGCTGIYLAQPGDAEEITVSPPDPLAARRQPPAPPAADVVRDAPAPGFQPAFAGLSIDDDATNEHGEVEQALARLKATAEQRPEDAEASSAVGELLVGLERAEEAIPYLQSAVALNSERFTYRMNLARALARLQRWDEAVAAYRGAKTISPDDPATAFELAEALQRAGDDLEN